MSAMRTALMKLGLAWSAAPSLGGTRSRAAAAARDQREASRSSIGILMCCASGFAKSHNSLGYPQNYK